MPGLDMYTQGMDNLETVHIMEVLPGVVGHIVGRDREGSSVFLSKDGYDICHQELFKEPAIITTIYSKHHHDFQLNNEYDYKNVPQPHPQISTENSPSCRIIDLAPNSSSPTLQTNTFEYTIIIEGTLNLTLDSGEERTLHPVDIVIQQSPTTTTHKWINLTSKSEGNNPLTVAHLLTIPLTITDPYAAAAVAAAEEEKMWKKRGLDRRASDVSSRRDSAISLSDRRDSLLVVSLRWGSDNLSGQSNGDGIDGLDGGGGGFVGSEYWESEF